MKEITLPDSGVTLRVDRVPPFLLSDIRNDISSRLPKPKPPIIKVRIGADDLESEEENKSDPSYQADLQQHRINEGRLFIEALVEIAVECEVNAEKIAKIRKWAGANNSLPVSDMVLYVTRVALETANDVEFFKNAVLGLSQPTDKAIEQSLNSFRTPNGAGVKRPDLQGA